MKDKLNEIYDNNIVHTSFLDKTTVMKCMEESYNEGITDFINWMSKMNHLSDNIDYIIEEYKNQNK